MAKAVKKGVKKAKKKAVKKTPKKKKVSSSKAKKTPRKKTIVTKTEVQLDQTLTENFVSLQNVMVGIATKLDNLTDNLEQLLKLFEVSAKTLAEKDIDSPREHKDTKAILEKLEKLSQQTALVGRGLELIHQMASGRPHEEPLGDMQMQPSPSYAPPARPMAPPQQIPPARRESTPESQGYSQSMGSPQKKPESMQKEMSEERKPSM